MRRRGPLIVLAVIVLAVALAVFAFLRRGGGGDEDDAASPEAVAAITVASASVQQVEETIDAYGAVEADPAAVLTIAAPKALVVSRILARPGQSVTAGQAVIEVADTAASSLAYKQATDAVQYAQSDLDQTQRLYDGHLASNDQLNSARKALSDAQSTLAAQRQQGAGQASLVLSAPAAGVVTAIPVSAGDHVAQDAPLASLAKADGLAAKLSLQPGAATPRPGEKVTIQSTSGGPAVQGAVSMVGKVVDPATKAFDVVVPLSGDALPVGTAVQGHIVLGGHAAILIPRAALVNDETGPHVFTIAGGKATRVFVKTGQESGDQIEVTGLAAGAQVAVQGAYELEDGMAVKVAAP